MKLWTKNKNLSGVSCSRFRIEKDSIYYVEKIFTTFEVLRTWLFCFKDHKPLLIKDCLSFEKYKEYLNTEEVSGIKFMINFNEEEVRLNVIIDTNEVVIATDNSAILKEIVNYIK